MPEILTEIMSGRVDFTCSTIGHRTAFHPRGQARGARGEHAATLVRAARCADHDRGRL
jgi:hypothetical protein